MENTPEQLKQAENILSTLEGERFERFYGGPFEDFIGGIFEPGDVQYNTRAQILDMIIKVFRLPA